jgi:hypothetical protein
MMIIGIYATLGVFLFDGATRSGRAQKPHLVHPMVERGTRRDHGSAGHQRFGGTGSSAWRRTCAVPGSDRSRSLDANRLVRSDYGRRDRGWVGLNRNSVAENKWATALRRSRRGLCRDSRSTPRLSKHDLRSRARHGWHFLLFKISPQTSCAATRASRTASDRPARAAGRNPCPGRVSIELDQAGSKRTVAHVRLLLMRYSELAARPAAPRRPAAMLAYQPPRLGLLAACG